VTTAFEPKPFRIRNIFICSREVFCASSRITKSKDCYGSGVPARPVPNRSFDARPPSQIAGQRVSKVKRSLDGPAVD